MKLYEINEEIMSLVSEDGEVLDEDRYNELELAKGEKLENLALWIKDMKSDIEQLKNEEKAFSERRKTVERRLESVKNFLSYQLEGKKFETPKVAVNFRKTQRVEVDDEFMTWAIVYGDEYLSYKEPTISKTAIKDAIKNGTEVPHATLVDDISLSVK